jgi:hypothetical protein
MGLREVVELATTRGVAAQNNYRTYFIPGLSSAPKGAHYQWRTTHSNRCWLEIYATYFGD